MTSRTPLRRFWDNLVARTAAYYVALFAAGWLLGGVFPGLARLLSSQYSASPAPVGQGTQDLLRSFSQPLVGGQASDMMHAAVAMTLAVALTIPVAWLYILTRRKKGFRQSMVHTLIMLPLVVAGVVVLVKNSIALAFSLAGIVAAVRFRNTLEDSKDAVYVFLAVSIGLAAGVDLPVALALSLIFNLAILGLWYSDFGRTSAVFEGAVAEERLEEARKFAGRQSSFITKLDDEILKQLSAEQLDVVAEKAWKRKKQAAPDAADDENEPGYDVLLRIRTTDAEEAKRVAEPVLAAHLKKWRISGIEVEGGGVQVVEYALRLRRNVTPNVLRDALQATGSSCVIGVEIQ